MLIFEFRFEGPELAILQAFTLREQNVQSGGRQVQRNSDAEHRAT